MLVEYSLEFFLKFLFSLETTVKIMKICYYCYYYLLL